MLGDDAATTLDVVEPRSIEASSGAVHAAACDVVDRAPPRRAWAFLFDSAMVATIATAGGMFVLFALQGVLLSHMLGVEVSGAYACATAYPQVLMYMGLLGTGLAVARRAGSSAASPSDLMPAAGRMGFVSGCLTAVVAAVLGALTLPGDKRWLWPWCVAAACMIPAEHIRLAVMSVDHGSRRFGRFNFYRVFAAGTLPALLSVAWLLRCHSLTVAVALAMVAPLLSLLPALCAGSLRNVFRSAAPGIRSLLREGRPFFVGSLVEGLAGRFDLLCMQYLGTLAQQGAYRVCVPTAGVMVLAPQALALFAFNAGTRRNRPADRSRNVLACLAVVGLQIFAVAVFLPLVPFLIPLVFGRDFQVSVPYAQWLVPAAAINGCGIVAEGFLRGRGRALLGASANMLGILTTFVALATLYSRMSALAIPCSVLIGRCVSTLTQGVLVLRELRSSVAVPLAVEGAHA